MAELKYVKELQGTLQTPMSTAGTLLIETKIYDTLMADVDKALIPRSEAAMYFGPAQIGSSSTIDINKEDENTMDVRVVAEGAVIPNDTATYNTTQVRPLKYGVCISITREMLEDAKWNLLQDNIRVAGKRFADNETNLILTQLQGCTQTVSGAAAFTINNLTTAMQELEDHDYSPTTLFVGNEVLNDLRNIDTFVEADKMGNRDILATGFVGSLYGLNVVRFSTLAAPSTTYAKYAYVTDRSKAYVIAEKRPIRVEQFNLPNYDMQAAAITQRIAVARCRDNAICRVSTS